MRMGRVSRASTEEREEDGGAEVRRRMITIMIVMVEMMITVVCEDKWIIKMIFLLQVEAGALDEESFQRAFEV